MAKEKNKTKIRSDFGQYYEYTTIQYGSRMALNLLPKVVKLSAVPTAHSVGAVPTLNIKSLLLDNHRIGSEKVSEAIEYLCNNFAELGPEFFIEILSFTQRTGHDGTFALGQEEDFDRAFQGNLGEMFRAVFWVLEVNFGPLVKGVVGPVAERLQQAFAQEQEESQRTAT